MSTLDHPLSWPRPGEGYGTGSRPFRDEQFGTTWIISSYADIDRVLRDHRTFSSRWADGPTRKEAFAPLEALVGQDPRAEDAMLFSRLAIETSDGDAHVRERSFIAKLFTPKRVRSLEPMIHGFCTELLDPIAGQRDVPIVQRLCMPLPTKVIAHVLGMPPEDYLDFKRWSDGFQAVIGTPTPTPEGIEAFLAASAEFRAYLTPLVEERRRVPTDDLISVLVGENEAGDRLATDEIVHMCAAIMMGGNETTAMGLAGLLLYLVRTPGVEQALRADRSRIPPLIEESLRLSSPVQALFRTATADAELSGVPIAEGEHVFLRFAAGNRDDHQFDVPLCPVLDRSDKRHLAFGRGVHVCPGAPLARAELQIAVKLLLDRTSAITLSTREEPLVPFGNYMLASIGELYLDLV